MYANQDVFVVTGATSGIGKGVVFSLLKEGASVIAVGRNIQKLDLLKDEISDANNLILEEKDLSNCDGLDKWILSISKKYGKLKGLVLSAGIQQITPISSVLSVEKSKELFEINYFSNIQLAKGFCDRRANIGKGSSIVFLSSIASIRGNSGIVGYAASKGAINSAVKSLAIEVARLGIRVNAVLPGFVMTKMIESWKEVYNEEYIENINKSYPLGIGSVSDVVEPILFLLSGKARWITGSELVVDGGGSL
ncbi:MAG: SDR family oxidoreductase [Campylobacterota bacterium]|nr:SDR family oxidoreductase [Campylobacterota bacterium]